MKSLKYLGFTINSKNCNFAKTPVDLSIRAKRAIFALNNKTFTNAHQTCPQNIRYSNFPYITMVHEVWASYCSYNITNWDTCVTEMIHTQFLKRILGCGVHTPNLMIRGELGRRPLLCDAIRRSVIYIKHVDINNESLANVAMDFKISQIDECNILSLARNFTNYFSELSNYSSPKARYDDIWINFINLLLKSDTFISLPLNLAYELRNILRLFKILSIE